MSQPKADMLPPTATGGVWLGNIHHLQSNGKEPTRVGGRTCCTRRRSPVALDFRWWPCSCRAMPALWQAKRWGTAGSCPAARLPLSEIGQMTPRCEAVRFYTDWIRDHGHYSLVRHSQTSCTHLRDSIFPLASRLGYLLKVLQSRDL